MDLIRDAPIGQVIRYITRNKVLLYPEERADFQCPMSYAEPDAAAKAQKEALASPSSTSEAISSDDPADAEKAGVEPAEAPEAEEPSNRPGRQNLERLETSHSGIYRAETAPDLEKTATMRTELSRVGTKSALEKSYTQADLQAAFSAASLAPEPSRPIIPERTSDGTILVDWYDETLQHV